MAVLLSTLYLIMAVLSLVLAEDLCFTDSNVENMPTNIRSNLYSGQQAFALQMLQTVQKSLPNENIFISPYSTFNSLLLAYFGASGKAEEELRQALRLGWAEHKKHVSSAYRLEKQKRHSRSQRMPLELVSADKIYVDSNVDILPCMKEHFRDELEASDFQNNPEGCRSDINSWIAQVTKNEIPQMLAPGDITAQTQMVLVNSAYFKGKWVNKFDQGCTKPGIFYTTKNQHSFVPMMCQRGLYQMDTEKLQAQVLKMPYETSADSSAESEISMVIILPPFIENQLEKVLSKLTPELLHEVLRDAITKEVDVTMPKFDFKQDLQLLPIYRKMGINSVFDEPDSLSGFSKTSKLHLNDAKHLAKIRVDEEGTTAAAATVMFSYRTSRFETAKFECNHPFIFLIYDETARAILFAGIFREPSQQN